MRRLPGPIFNYIDGAADDEVTYRRNTASFEDCDLVPNVLRGRAESRSIRDGDGSEARGAVLLLADRAAAPVQPRRRARGRRRGVKVRNAVRRVVARYGQSGRAAQEVPDTPQVYQFYFHKDRGLNRAMLQRAKDAGVDVMMLTVDSITGGNRERDLRTGFSIPFRLTLAGMLQFAIKPAWGIELSHA